MRLAATGAGETAIGAGVEATPAGARPSATTARQTAGARNAARERSAAARIPPIGREAGRVTAGTPLAGRAAAAKTVLPHPPLRASPAPAASPSTW